MPDQRPDSDAKTEYGVRVLRLVEPALEGYDVWELQIKLIAWGSGNDNDGIGSPMDPVRVHGVFDRTTRDAVMRFQKKLALPITGVVHADTYQALDRQAALLPVLCWDLRCPCATGANDGPILCRCEKHELPGKCTGWGNKRYEDESSFLLKGKKLADDSTDLSGEELDLYQMREYEGIDKAVLWAARGLARRADLKAIKVLSGYRCWWDNYHHTDETRWHHRRETFHFGKAVEFRSLDPSCTKTEGKDGESCPECNAVRAVAFEKCGFQRRWHEKDRVAVADSDYRAPPPTTPFSIRLDTVRRLRRDADPTKGDFIKTDFDAAKPTYQGKVVELSFPIPQPSDATELDPRFATSEPYFRNTERGAGGWFPFGRSRFWHGGVHLHCDDGTLVHSIGGGEIIGCRVGAPSEDRRGSRNFVLVKHLWRDKEFFALYQHLRKNSDLETDRATWLAKLSARAKKHVRFLAPSSVFNVVEEGTDPNQVDRLRTVAERGYNVGDEVAIKEGEHAADSLDNSLPTAWKLVELDLQPAPQKPHYVFLKREDQDMAEIFEANTELAGKITGGEVIGLEKGIPVSAGEVLGEVAEEATADELRALGSFLHFETFAAENLLGDQATAEITVAKDALADRKELVKTLTEDPVSLLASPPDGVLLESDVEALFQTDPSVARFRGVALKMPNSGAVDWKEALKKPDALKFLEETTLDEIGDAWNEHSWWKEVKDQKGPLPGSEEVFHFHPIALLVHLAFQE